jgi:hypothetical protein
VLSLDEKLDKLIALMSEKEQQPYPGPALLKSGWISSGVILALLVYTFGGVKWLWDVDAKAEDAYNGVVSSVQVQKTHKEELESLKNHVGKHDYAIDDNAENIYQNKMKIRSFHP